MIEGFKSGKTVIGYSIVGNQLKSNPQRNLIWGKHSQVAELVDAKSFFNEVVLE